MRQSQQKGRRRTIGRRYRQYFRIDRPKSFDLSRRTPSTLRPTAAAYNVQRRFTVAASMMPKGFNHSIRLGKSVAASTGRLSGSPSRNRTGDSDCDTRQRFSRVHCLRCPKGTGAIIRPIDPDGLGGSDLGAARPWPLVRSGPERDSHQLESLDGGLAIVEVSLQIRCTAPDWPRRGPCSNWTIALVIP